MSMSIPREPRHFRYSLRGLLGAITLVCVLWGLTIGLGTHHVEQIIERPMTSAQNVWSPAPCVVLAKVTEYERNEVQGGYSYSKEGVTTDRVYLWIAGLTLRIW